MFRGLVQSIADAIPGQCAICRAWPAEPLCEGCVARFAQPVHRCRTCAVALPEGIEHCGECVRRPPPLDACIAALSYGFPWSRRITEFKFRDRPDGARSLARLLHSAPWVEPALDAARWVLPMPLSTRRLRERGYNQALELGRHLAPTKLDGSLLLRLRDTAPQTALDRAQRHRNVRHAFAVDPLRAAELASARVVLLDDVMTSGASIFAAAAALRQAGAAHITAIVLARAEPGRTAQ